MARQALNNFKKMADEMLLSKTQTIMQALDGNTNFDPLILDLIGGEALLDDFKVKLSSARRKGSPLETELKDESRLALEEWLRVLAFQINMAANGKLSILLSSGFDISSVPSPGLPPDTPTGLRVGDGRQRGQIRFDFAPVPTATGYEYRYTDEVDSAGRPAWGDRLYTSSSRNNVLSPVSATHVYYVQVRALNPHGASDWSYVLDWVAR